MGPDSTNTSYFDLVYPEDDEMAGPLSSWPISPINYDMLEAELQTHSMQEEYDNFYRFSPIAGKGDKGIRTPNNEEIWDASSETTMRADKTGPHPGPPWFKWDEKSGHLGYQAVD
jgi:hypothetical protein